MADIIVRLKKIQEKIANKKAEKKLALERIEELEKELKEKGIKSEDLGKHIGKLSEERETLKTKIESKLKEAEDELNSTDSK